MTSRKALFLLAFATFWCPIGAKGELVKEPLPFIEARWSFFGPTLRYAVDGEMVENKEMLGWFKKAEAEESLKLWRKARSLQAMHFLTFLGGVAGVWIIVRNAREGEKWRDGVLAAAGFGFVTELFRQGAVRLRLEAVNQYNRIVYSSLTASF